MKTMKLMAIVFLLTCFISNLNSQSRTSSNTSGGFVLKAKSEKLKSATGWKQDAIGGWVSNQNAISDIQLNDQNRYSVPQNFKWIQFVSFNCNNKDVYVLLYENIAYVSNSQNERRVHYYLIAPSSYANLESAVTSKDGKTLTVHSNAYGYMSDKDGTYSQEKLLKLIALSMTNSNNAQCDLAVNAQHVDNADVVRFRLPEQSSILGDGLTDGYFEVKWGDFKSILLPVTASVVQQDEFDLDAEVTPVALKSNNLRSMSDDGLADRNAESKSEHASEFTMANEVPQILDQAYNTPNEGSANIIEVADRVSRERAVASDPIATLGNIQGWYFNKDGKWVSDSDHTYEFETVGGYEFRNLRYKGNDYLVITRFEKYAGANYFLISKDEYVDEISKLNTSPILKFRVIAHCGVGNTIDDLVKKAEEVIDAPEKEKIIIRDFYLMLQYRGSDVKNIARFFIYGLNCTQYGESGSTSCDVKVSSRVKYDDVPIVGTNDLFSKMYYEVSYADFSTFLQAPLKVSRPQEKVIVDNSDDGLGARN